MIIFEGKNPSCMKGQICLLIAHGKRKVKYDRWVEVGGGVKKSSQENTGLIG